QVRHRGHGPPVARPGAFSFGDGVPFSQSGRASPAGRAPCAQSRYPLPQTTGTLFSSRGTLPMRTLHRSALLASLVPAFLLGGMCAVAQAQDSGSAMRWSDPATWPNRKVPVEGDKVVISRDKTVVLDVSPPPLNGLSIDGKLVFSDDADLELTTEWIMLHGELQIGTADRPHTRKATITFTDNVKGEDIMAGMGDRGIMISGGTLNLHGNRTHTWTKLAKTANRGATQIEVLDASQWQVG